MNELLAAQALLGKVMLTSPRLTLANVVAWLDPAAIQIQQSEDDGGYSDDEDDISIALDACRSVFPDIYASASQLIWQGANEQTLERHLWHGINAKLVMKMDSLEEIRYGVPVTMMGVSFYEDGFFENNPDLVGLLADFDIDSDCEQAEITTACQLANALFASLELHTGSTYHKLRMLLSWLFASSGNTCVDMTMEDFWESGIALLDWELENVAAMNDMATEAIAIVDEAQEGLRALQTDTVLREAFRRNVGTLQQQGRKKGSYDHLVKRLRWPDCP